MRLFSIILLALISNIAIGQNDIFKAIGKADVSALSETFSNDIEICIGTEQDFYSKGGAIKRLEKFFGQVEPKSSAFKHKGNSKDKTSEYSVGTMTTTKGNYRVFIYYEGSKVTGLMFNLE
jgi:hypothetical protein